MYRDIKNRREAQRRYRQRHPEIVAARVKKWERENRQKVNAIKRRYRKNNKLKILARERAYRKRKRAHLNAYQQARRYGLTVAQFQNMVAAQSGKCAICNLSARLYVDHDHDRGHIRGLLCHQCNAGLGYFKDDCSLLSSAAVYITHTKELKNAL
jgi:hypothetical protein